MGGLKPPAPRRGSERVSFCFVMATGSMDVFVEEEAFAYASARDYTYTAGCAARKAGMSQGSFVRYARMCGVYRRGGCYRIDDILAVMRARVAKRKGGVR